MTTVSPRLRPRLALFLFSTSVSTRTLHTSTNQSLPRSLIAPSAILA